MPHFKYSKHVCSWKLNENEEKRIMDKSFFCLLGGLGGRGGWGLNAKGDKERKPLDKQILTGC